MPSSDRPTAVSDEDPVQASARAHADRGGVGRLGHAVPHRTARRPGVGAPLALVEGVGAWADRLTAASTALGAPVAVDPLAVLAERAAMTGLTRGGDVSCGGGTRLLPCADGWVAVSLTREDDWDLVAAWLGRARPVDPGDWATVSAAVTGSEGAGLRAGAELLGAAGGRARRTPPRRPGSAAASPGRRGGDPRDPAPGTSGRRPPSAPPPS